MTEVRKYDYVANRVDVKDIGKRKLIHVWVGGRVPIVEMDMSHDQAVGLSRALAPYKALTRKEYWQDYVTKVLAFVGFLMVAKDVMSLLTWIFS